MTKTKGAKEEGWGEGGSINFQSGCRGNCEYCYARWGACKRLPLFIRADAVLMRKNWEAWANTPVLRTPTIEYFTKPRYFKKPVMFPTTHDIDQKNLYEAKIVLNSLLQGNTPVRIVSKADPACFRELFKVVEHYNDPQIEFRVTLGSLEPHWHETWERGTPTPSDRVTIIREGAEIGLKMSGSGEPCNWDVVKVFDAIYDYVDTFWIGPMNHVEQIAPFWSVPLQQYYIRKLAPLYEAPRLLRLTKLLREQDYKKKLRLKDTMPKSVTKPLTSYLGESNG